MRSTRRARTPSAYTQTTGEAATLASTALITRALACGATGRPRSRASRSVTTSLRRWALRTAATATRSWRCTWRATASRRRGGLWRRRFGTAPRPVRPRRPPAPACSPPRRLTRARCCVCRGAGLPAVLHKGGGPRAPRLRERHELAVRLDRRLVGLAPLAQRPVRREPGVRDHGQLALLSSACVLFVRERKAFSRPRLARI